MDKLNCDRRKDPVMRMIRDLTPSEFVSWLIEHHGLPVESMRTVEINLRDQFKFHRLQGRLDRKSNLAILADLWKLRQSVMVLSRAPEPVPINTIEEDYEAWLKTSGVHDVDEPERSPIFKAFAANWRPNLR